jgi:hypothetical protein
VAFAYELFGHRINSPIPLDGLAGFSSAEGGETVIDLVVGELAEPDYGDGLSHALHFDEGGASGSLSLTRDASGAFTIFTNTVFELDDRRVHARIDHDPVAGRLQMRENRPIDPLEVVSFLVSPSMPLWLRATHRFLPLHASVIALDDKAVAICGPSGAGKTTLALHCRQRSLAIMADDMAAIDWNTGMVHHGAAFSRLDQQQFALIEEGGATRRSPRFPKSLLDTGQHPYWSDPRPLPLAGIILLTDFQDDQPISIEPIPAVEAGIALNANLTGEMFPPTKAQRQAGLSAAMAVAKKVAVYRLRRSGGLDHLDATVDAICHVIQQGQ